MDKHFGGVIWTNHALDRLRERGIKQGDAWATWRNPQESYKSELHKGEDAWRYYRTYSNERIEVVAKKGTDGKWIILSVWSKPSFQSQTKTPSFWKFIFKKLFG